MEDQQARKGGISRAKEEYKLWSRARWRSRCRSVRHYLGGEAVPLDGVGEEAEQWQHRGGDSDGAR